jgi:hypothetical protein
MLLVTNYTCYSIFPRRSLHSPPSPHLQIAHQKQHARQRITERQHVNKRELQLPRIFVPHHKVGCHGACASKTKRPVSATVHTDKQHICARYVA